MYQTDPYVGIRNITNAVLRIWSRKLPGGFMDLEPQGTVRMLKDAYSDIRSRYDGKIQNLEYEQPSFVPTHLYKDVPVIKGDPTKSGKIPATYEDGRTVYIKPEKWEDKAKKLVAPTETPVKTDREVELEAALDAVRATLPEDHEAQAIVNAAIPQVAVEESPEKKEENNETQ